MSLRIGIASGATALALCLGAASAAAQAEPSAPLLEGLGDYRFPVATTNPTAQRFVDQGMLLSHAFNHAEAERSFREAARFDPQCAMAWWGVALVLGPNINLPMQPEAIVPAWEAIREAEKRAKRASPKERDYIAALRKRYAAEPPNDRSGLDQAYADAMRVLHRKYPDDPDVAALCAEALMDLHPWDFWHKDGSIQPWTQEILDLLVASLELAPEHPLANHLYIHGVEASKDPGRAVPSADRLRRMTPGAGHMVHMPSHIYIRVGRYADGTLANELATEADEEYAAQCRAQGVYRIGYIPHNHHFLWASASLEGHSAKALAAARSTADHVVMEALGLPGLEGMQHFLSIPYFAMVQFGRWEEMLAEPAPPESLVYATGVWHFGRGMAFARTGRPVEAEAERAAVVQAAADRRLDGITFFGINAVRSVLDIGSLVLDAEGKAATKDYDAAVGLFREAIAREDTLHYTEPPDWFFPVRHNLGAVLLEAGRAEEAERVYREDLSVFPENGWALYGLAQALRERGDLDGAREAEARFHNAWAGADVRLTASRF